MVMMSAEEKRRDGGKGKGEGEGWMRGRRKNKREKKKRKAMSARGVPVNSLAQSERFVQFESGC
jgi:hypothetical protein